MKKRFPFITLLLILFTFQLSAQTNLNTAMEKF